MHAVPAVNPIFQDNKLKPEQKREGINKLIQLKRIGRRGHLWFDICTLILILCMFIASVFLLRTQLTDCITIVCLIGIVIGFSLTLFEFLFYQREPSKQLVNKILASFREA